MSAGDLIGLCVMVDAVVVMCWAVWECGFAKRCAHGVAMRGEKWYCARCVAKLEASELGVVPEYSGGGQPALGYPYEKMGVPRPGGSISGVGWSVDTTGVRISGKGSRRKNGLSLEWANAVMRVQAEHLEALRKDLERERLRLRDYSSDHQGF